MAQLKVISPIQPLPLIHQQCLGVLGYDAYAFDELIDESVLQAADGLRINRLGSDLLLVEAMANASYHVIDPCLLVSASHYHCTQVNPPPGNDDRH